MQHNRSPFLVIPNFLSPLTCEEIIDTVAINFPETDAKGRPCKSVMGNRLVESRLSDYLEEALDLTEDYYDISVKGVHPLTFEYYPEGCATSEPACENSAYINGDWVRSNNKDFVGFIFLNEYQEKAPFDPYFEVRGGKLQFPTHGFGFNPKRGMLVIFPGNEYFMHSTSAVDVGDLYQIKVHFTTEEMYKYDPNAFPGNYKEWF